MNERPFRFTVHYRLISATDERLDLANPEHLRHARILAETMVARTGYKFPNDNPD